MVIAEIKGGQMGEVDDLLGELGEAVAPEIKVTEPGQGDNLLREFAEMIITEIQVDQGVQISKFQG